MRILFLHGFTQSADLFSRKASALRKVLTKAGHITDFLDGPFIVDSESLPFESAKGIEMRSWWEPNEHSPEFMKLDSAFKVISDYIDANGPIDGLVGFSQGAGLAAILTKQFPKLKPAHPPLKFCVIYSGFCMREPHNQEYYTSPFDTRSLHVVGTLDTVVSEERSKKLYDLWADDKKQMLKHAGGHYVPSTKSTLDVVTGFIDSSNSENSEKAATTPAAVEEGEVDDWDAFDKIGQS